MVSIPNIQISMVDIIKNGPKAIFELLFINFKKIKIEQKIPENKKDKYTESINPSNPIHIPIRHANFASP